MANNTGVFFNINDNDGIPLVGVSTDGRVFLDPFYGNVGIGTTNPSVKLDVIGNTKVKGDFTVTNGDLHITRTDTATGDILANGGTDGIFGIENTTNSGSIYLSARNSSGSLNNTITFNSSSATINGSLTVAGVGASVGIGTDNPSEKLSVYGAVESLYDTLGEGGQFILRGKTGTPIRWNIDNYSIGGGATNLFRIFKEDNSTAGANGRVYVGITTIGEFIIGDGAGDLSPTGTANQQLQVQSGAYVSGNVGIGTTNPSVKLDVIGNTKVKGDFTVTNGDLHITRTDTATGDILANGGTDGIFGIENTTNSGSIYLSARNSSGSLNNTITFNSSSATINGSLTVAGVGASVGIGTDNPTAKLDVLGDVNISGILTASKVASGIPQNTKTSAYILQKSDVGKYISITSGGVTVPSGIFSEGDVISVYNNSASNQTITQGDSVTMYFSGTSTTGNRTLSQRGLSTILCVGSNTFIIGGAGLS